MPIRFDSIRSACSRYIGLWLARHKLSGGWWAAQRKVALAVDREIVIAAYQSILGREPESEAVIDHYVRSRRPVPSLLKGLAASEECRGRNAMGSLSDTFSLLHGKAQDIEVSVPDAILSKLMTRVQGQWKKLGESDPYWSVLTDQRFRMENIDEAARNELFASGAASAALIEHFESSNQRKLSRGSCFELGCGVGRVTLWLAKQFTKVIAADISPGNLELCRKNLESQGIHNVEYWLMGDIAAYDGIPEFDVLFSVIVLQHNSPPIQKLMIDKLLRKIRPGGGCLFQTPAFISGYSFDAEKYLATEVPVLEMHALPMHVVMEELYDKGLRTLSVTLDQWTGMPGSYTYFAVK